MPAEWAPHSAIWLAWPYDETTFPGRVPQAEAAYINMIEAIHRSEAVQLLVKTTDVRECVKSRLMARGVDMSRVFFHMNDYVDVWFRDYGPTFVVNEAEQKLAMVHWRFNAWGGKYQELIKDTAIPAWMNAFMKIPRFEPGIVMEGGSFEVNGAGTVMTTVQCLLNKNRNPRLEKPAIEKRLHDFLGTRHAIWLGEGIVGDDTDGHIDDIARFVNSTTIVCAREEDPQDENHKLLEDNWRRLQAARDQDGRPFTLVKLPMPGVIGDAEGRPAQGEARQRRLPASYANFYIGNTVVLLPIFGHTNDAKAQGILQEVFPGRKVVPIDARDLVFGLGAIHCISQQQPSV